MFRVTKPGGICVITDSFQKGDFPERDHIGHRLPANYHEPYYSSYFENTDLVKIFQAEGFKLRRHQCAHLSKVLTFDKPDPTADEEGLSTKTLSRLSNDEDGARWAVV
jgi:ubiquinone/menaquinone biosynthesis C-methylase UbiE